MLTISKLQYALNMGLSKFEYDQILTRLNKEPNFLEIALFSAMWSEHCSYKHSKKLLNYLNNNKHFDYIDPQNNGIKIGNKTIFFKMESHNHPCMIDPFQGAATGVGGIIRDIIAFGAQPKCLINSLKFGLLQHSKQKYLLEKVTEGISFYSNCTGIPTISGETIFNHCYNENILVNIFCLGIGKYQNIKKDFALPNLNVVLIGSKTGKDGINGASFASKNLENEQEKSRLSIQIACPFFGKNLIEATLKILKLKGTISCQDCGAAGILSSTSEMAFKGNCSIQLYLNNVPLQSENMTPSDIMLSETQERMVFLCKDSALEHISNICDKYSLSFGIIGKTLDKSMTSNIASYILHYNGEIVANLPLNVLNEPYLYDLAQNSVSNSIYKNFVKRHNICKNTKQTENLNLVDILTNLIKNDENFISKNWIFSQYDSTVKGNTVQGCCDYSQIGAIFLDDGNFKEVGKILGVLSHTCPVDVFINPKLGTEKTVLQAYRSLCSCGFEPIAISDCLNFANPENDFVKYQFHNCILGLKNVCRKLNLPIISGNVSFYNESSKHQIYPSPTICILGTIESFQDYISNSAQEDNIIFVIQSGHRKKFDFGFEVSLKNHIFELKKQNLIDAIRNTSKGGILFSLFQMILQKKLGFKFSIENSNTSKKFLLDEDSLNYLIATSKPDSLSNFFFSRNIPFLILGEIQKEPKFSFGYTNQEITSCFDLYFNRLKGIMS